MGRNSDERDVMGDLRRYHVGCEQTETRRQFVGSFCCAADVAFRQQTFSGTGDAFLCAAGARLKTINNKSHHVASGNKCQQKPSSTDGNTKHKVLSSDEEQQ